MARGINVSCTYLQDEKGVPVSADRAKTIRNLMLSCFRQLDTQGLAPESIGQASLQVLRWLIHTLRKECIEFRLCADNWKVMKLLSENYSQWFNYHIKKKKTGKHIKSESDGTMSLGESSSVLSEDTNLPLVRPQKHTCETDEEPEAAHTKKRARIDQLITVTEPATDEAVEAVSFFSVLEAC